MGEAEDSGRATKDKERRETPDRDDGHHQQ